MLEAPMASGAMLYHIEGNYSVPERPTHSGISTFRIPRRCPHQLNKPPMYRPPTTRRGSPYPHALHHKCPGCSQAPGGIVPWVRQSTTLSPTSMTTTTQCDNGNEDTMLHHLSITPCPSLCPANIGLQGFFHFSLTRATS